MAPNIFNDTDAGVIRARLYLLRENSPSKWGIMHISQMLAHCSIQLKLALGELPVQPKESSFLYRTRAGRWLSLYVIPWPRGFETPAIMNMATNGMPVRGFETERRQLLQLLEKVVVADSFMPHPFYGTINKQQWGRLVWVHLDHHLRQFGV